MKTSDTFKKEIEEYYAISFRLPKNIANQMYALAEKSGKSSASFISYAVTHYIGEVTEQPIEDKDPFEIDHLSFKLLKKQNKCLI